MLKTSCLSVSSSQWPSPRDRLSVFCLCSASDRSLVRPQSSILFGMSTALVDVSSVFFKHEDTGTGPALARRFLPLSERAVAAENHA